jgi:hypothetical protein
MLSRLSLIIPLVALPLQSMADQADIQRLDASAGCFASRITRILVRVGSASNHR